jgi:phytoene/squalene synthetase
MSIELYNNNAQACSRQTTQRYSTSFTLGIKLLGRDIRKAIYAIYAFVRFADEIVDTFHTYDKAALLEKFRRDTHSAISQGISTNPILQSFQLTANQYQIDTALIEAFFESMAMDLSYKKYDQSHYQSYIYGSAEVVGLMCLKVFYHDDPQGYETLKHPARKLGQAFQKVNFLRDVQSDLKERGRTYFPNVDLTNFSISQKKQIEKEIEADFQEAYLGIVKLNKEARRGVYIAYRYYLRLFNKIKNSPPKVIMRSRIRVNNWIKMKLLFEGVLRHELNCV